MNGPARGWLGLVAGGRRLGRFSHGRGARSRARRHPSALGARRRRYREPDLILFSRCPDSRTACRSFTSATAQAGRRPIATWHDKSLIINFWATWCAPCRREIPLLAVPEWRMERHGRLGGGRCRRPPPRRGRLRGRASKSATRCWSASRTPWTWPANWARLAGVSIHGVHRRARPTWSPCIVGELHRAQADLILSVVQNSTTTACRLPQARRNIAAGLQS